MPCCYNRIISCDYARYAGARAAELRYAARAMRRVISAKRYMMLPYHEGTRYATPPCLAADLMLLL